MKFPVKVEMKVAPVNYCVPTCSQVLLSASQISHAYTRCTIGGTAVLMASHQRKGPPEHQGLLQKGGKRVAVTDIETDIILRNRRACALNNRGQLHRHTLLKLLN